MFRACTKLHLLKVNNVNSTKVFADNHNVYGRQFSTESEKNTQHSSSNREANYREAFKNLNAKINVKESQENLNSYTYGNSFEGMKHKLYENFKHSQEKLYNKANFNNFIHPGIKAPYQNLKPNAKHEEDLDMAVKESSNNMRGQSPKKMARSDVQRDGSRVSLKGGLETLAVKSPLLGKVANYICESLQETFPCDNFCQRIQQVKKAAKEAAEKERERIQNMTEEELAKLQEGIPEWRRTAMILSSQTIHEDRSLRRRVINTLTIRINQSDAAKQMYGSEFYKDYQTFKAEMIQFKEDLKDHLHQSQNPVVMASLTAYSKVSLESNTARAINEMRKRIPGFSVYELERDARGVFCQIYDAYLEGNLDFIQTTCGDMGLAYFRTLLKKREVDNVSPMYSFIWDCESADLIGGRISMENNEPRFAFTIRVQEVYCNISNKTGKVVDGAEDRVIQTRYNFVLALHDHPDLEMTGHPWELVEIMPCEATPMLA